MFYTYQNHQSYRFRRFAHKAYSAFASMHREVSIGRVSRAICDLEMLKAGRTTVLCGVVMCSSFALADDSPQGLTAEEMAQQLSLQEVLVQAKKTEVQARSYRLVTAVEASDLEALPVSSAADMLTYLPGLDVRRRGNNGVQADVSLRGGTFDQVRVLLNGIDLSDAHTGHYAMNLPVPSQQIERIEVMDGAVNIVTRTTPYSSARLSAGMYGLVNPEVNAGWTSRGWNFTATAEYNRSDGFSAPNPSEKEKTAMENSDYRIANVYFRAKGVVDIQFGAQYKDAGAGMFYGFGSQTQRDKTSTMFASVSHTHHWGAWSLDTKAAYRANYDYYRWWRNEPVKGTNRHLTQNASAGLEAHYASWLGTTTVGISARNEHIFSTNLGEEYANPIQIGGRELTKRDNRLDLNYYAAQTFHHRGLSASVRADGHYNTRFGNYATGNANIGYQYAKNSSVYFNLSHSRRLPSFTDLYYNAGNQLGSRDLKPEKMTTFSVGNRYVLNLPEMSQTLPHNLTLEADAFYRLGRDIIDWVYVADDATRPYHATNQNQVNAAGCEATITYRLNEWLPCVRLSYAYTWLDLDLEKTGSRYLDYLSHKFTAHIQHAFYVNHNRNWQIGGAWTLTYKVRKGQYNNAEGEVHNYAPALTLDGQVYWQKAYGQNHTVRVMAEATNLTNSRYYDYGGILAPGTWAKATILFTL